GTNLPDLTKTRISLHAMDHWAPSMDVGMPVSPAPDGKFRIEGVRLVEQMVYVTGLGPGNYVKEIRYNGAALKGDVMTLESGAMAHQLGIVIDDKPGAITGAVMNGDRPVSRPFVIARKWPPPSVPGPSGMAVARGDEAGQFRMGGLVPGSLIEKRFDVASAVYHPENENVRPFDAVDNDVLANGEAARAGAEVFITGASGVREGGEEKEPTCYRVNQAGGDVHAGAFPGDVEPDAIKISFGLWPLHDAPFIGPIQQSGGRVRAL